MTIRAILFDVGGPLDTEIISERLIDEHIRAALTAEGIAVSESEYAAAAARAVAAFAPDAYRAIIWNLTGGRLDAAERVYAAIAARAPERHAARDGFELRDGIAAVLESMLTRGLALGLAANQPARVIAELDRVGIGRLFHHREVSGNHGFRKPDVRLFLRACQDLAVEPAQCIMVGDRIDNDIVPARLLGMRTLLLRAGRHSAQQARTWDELPRAEVYDVGGLHDTLLKMIGNGERIPR